MQEQETLLNSIHSPDDLKKLTDFQLERLCGEIRDCLLYTSSMEYLSVLIKAIGVCYLTQFSADSCRDAGESSLAGKVELAGKIAILISALPLLDSVISLAVNLIER